MSVSACVSEPFQGTCAYWSTAEEPYAGKTSNALLQLLCGYIQYTRWLAITPLDVHYSYSSQVTIVVDISTIMPRLLPCV